MSTTIIAACACGSFTCSITYPQTSLPLNRSFCLCDRCRRYTGSCGNTYIDVPADQTLDPTKFNLTAYKVSERKTRFFCSVCGAHAICMLYTPGSPVRSTIASGLWDKTEGIIKWNGCKWVEDTLDGGISVWLNHILDTDGTKRPLKRWILNDTDKGEIVSENSFKVLQQKPASDKLQAQCHCGGVKFYVTRPNEASKKVQSPLPDLMSPYPLYWSANPENISWWLRDNDTKYLAGTCTCTSCRKSLGMEVQTWAFIPKCNIFKTDDSPLDFDLGNLKSHASSEGVTREFCDTCGATVFWHCDWRPDLIDVGVGLFDPKEGARVEGWLDWWTDRVSFKELAVSHNLIESLEEGLKTCGM